MKPINLYLSLCLYMYLYYSKVYNSLNHMISLDKLSQYVYDITNIANALLRSYPFKRKQ